MTYMVLIICMLLYGSVAAGKGLYVRAGDGSRVTARIIEWHDDPLECGFLVIPRGYHHCLYRCDGGNGLNFRTLYGYVGIYTGDESSVVEGMNEAGLCAGLFCMPDSLQCMSSVRIGDDVDICSRNLVSWILSEFSCIDQIKDVLEETDNVRNSDGISGIRWRITEPGGRIAYIDVFDGIPMLSEGGQSASADSALTNGYDTVMQSFHILDSLYVPVVQEFSDRFLITCAADQAAMKLYFSTDRDNSIRCIDLLNIDFRKVRIQSRPLDRIRSRPVRYLKVR